MKKGINLAEALFIVLFAFKLKGWGLLGSDQVPSWFIVFLPLIIDAIWTIVAEYIKLQGWDKNVAFSLWKWLLNRRVNKAASKARKSYLNGNTGNPGQFVDPLNRGKI